MQLAHQGKISLEEDSAATNVITIESGHVDDKRIHITPRMWIISQAMRIHCSKRRIPLMLMIACLQLPSLTKICFLGLNLIIILCSLLDSCLMIQGFNQGGQRAIGSIKNAIDYGGYGSSALFLVIDAKTSYNMLLGRPWLHENAVVPSTWHQYFMYCRNDANKENEVLPPEEPKSCNNQNTRKNDSSTLEVELLKGLTLSLTQINMKQSSKPPLKGFAPSTQEQEGIHKALAINEKGFDPKAFKLLIKAGYDPKEKLSLGKLPPEATGKNLNGLNATQIMLKEKGHVIQDSQVGLGFTPPKPVRIAIKRVNNNYVSEGFSSTEDHKRKI
ncbi:hypothetical protein Sango_3015200 [Sesamum angolense]|uniref:G-patch domain-containing protein n=1 Tax=Sesamum angolense TaxID=2727404 RepID=A0AAE1T0Z5_9LAMI|nr:hypothetical protein Sango_3015200 [Sesamum angolense]